MGLLFNNNCHLGIGRMSERSNNYSNPMGKLSLEERLRFAKARVRNAKVLYELFPDTLHKVALEAREREVRDLELLLKYRRY